MMSVNLAFIDLNEQDQVCEYYNDIIYILIYEWNMIIIILGLVVRIISQFKEDCFTPWLVIVEFSGYIYYYITTTTSSTS